MNAQEPPLGLSFLGLGVPNLVCVKRTVQAIPHSTRSALCEPSHKLSRALWTIWIFALSTAALYWVCSICQTVEGIRSLGTNQPWMGPCAVWNYSYPPLSSTPCFHLLAFSLQRMRGEALCRDLLIVT